MVARNVALHKKVVASRVRCKETVQEELVKFLDRPFSVRHAGRNKGMTAQFEGHVRTMMATGGSGRQVRDNLVLCAAHFLDVGESRLYIEDIPTERGFLLQREALGVSKHFFIATLNLNRTNPNTSYHLR